MFVSHRQYTYGPPQPLTGMTLLCTVVFKHKFATFSEYLFCIFLLSDEHAVYLAASVFTHALKSVGAC